VDLIDSIDEAGVTQGDFPFASDLPVLSDGGGHDFLKARVNDVDLVGTLELVLLVSKAHDVKKATLRLHLVSLGHAARSDVVEVLEPLEVGAGDTTAIDKHVGSALDSSALEDLLGGEGGRAVGTLEDGFDLDLLSVSHVQRLLDGGGDQAVSLLREEGHGVLGDDLSGVGVGFERAVLEHMRLHGFDTETVGVVDGRVVLHNSGNFATVFLNELGGPVADGTESLNDEGLVLDTEGQAATFDEGFSVEELACCVVDTETRGLSSACNATLGDELAGAAALSVDVLLSLDVHVGILNPGHGLLVGAHVRAEAVNLRADEALLDELHGVLAS